MNSYNRSSILHHHLMVMLMAAAGVAIILTGCANPLLKQARQSETNGESLRATQICLEVVKSAGSRSTRTEASECAVRNAAAYYGSVVRYTEGQIRYLTPLRSQEVIRIIDEAAGMYHALDRAGVATAWPSELNRHRSIAKNYATESQLQTAQAEFAEAKYRSAYYSAQKILELDKGNLPARQLMEKALEKGRVRVAVLPFDGDPSSGSLTRMVKSNLASDPFVRLLDRTSLQAVLNETKLMMQQAGNKGGKIEAADYILKASISIIESEPTRTERENDEAWSLRTGMRVVYYEIEEEVGLRVNVSAELIDARTGAVVEFRNAYSKEEDSRDYNETTHPVSDMSTREPLKVTADNPTELDIKRTHAFDQLGQGLQNLLGADDRFREKFQKPRLSTRAELVERAYFDISGQIGALIKVANNP